MTRTTIVTLDPFVQEIKAESLRVGKQLLTADGWQTVRGMLIFQDADQVTVFTDERGDEHTDGWRFHFGDLVRSRLTPTAEQEYQLKRRARLERRRLRDLAVDAAGCPAWCTAHTDPADGRARNHSSDPAAIGTTNIATGEPFELNVWLEQRDDEEAGSVETFGVLEVGKIFEDVELTPEAMLALAGRLSSLAHRAQLYR